jgi:hypothetical protein
MKNLSMMLVVIACTSCSNNNEMIDKYEWSGVQAVSFQLREVDNSSGPRVVILSQNEPVIQVAAIPYVNKSTGFSVLLINQNNMNGPLKYLPREGFSIRAQDLEYFNRQDNISDRMKSFLSQSVVQK